MGVRKYKPTSPGRRHGMVSDFADITAKEPEKSLIAPLRRCYGRNTHGRITSRYRRRGAKRLYRVIDFKRNKDGVPAKVLTIEYDPNRTARIALLQYADGEKRYILAPRDITVGEIVESGLRVEPKSGNCMPLSSIPLGLPIHNIELQPNKGGQLVKSAGSVAQLSAREGGYAVIVLPSGEIRKVPEVCRATIGQLSHVDHMNISLGKAGRSFYLGRRGHVRGICRNPVDHPMGGGEGRSKSGKIPTSPWGQLAKGGKTRKPKKASSNLIIRGRKKKRK